jgi:hypothetical protein
MTSGIYPLNRGRWADLETDKVRAYLANLRIVKSAFGPPRTAGAPIRRYGASSTGCHGRGLYRGVASSSVAAYGPRATFDAGTCGPSLRVPAVPGGTPMAATTQLSSQSRIT